MTTDSLPSTDLPVTDRAILAAPAPRSLLLRRANRELRQHVLRNSNKPTGCRPPVGDSPPGTPHCGLGHTEEATMYPLPPAANPLIAGFDCPWLPPICFGVKPYLELCQSFDKALKELEVAIPVAPPACSRSKLRNKKLKRKPK